MSMNELLKFKCGKCDAMTGDIGMVIKGNVAIFICTECKCVVNCQWLSPTCMDEVLETATNFERIAVEDLA